MSYGIQQTRRFVRQYKKPHDNVAVAVAVAVDAAVAVVADSPQAGERKKDDLAQLLVYKFRSQGQRYLLGYTLDEQVCFVYLEAVGPHENLYRDLKRQPRPLAQGRRFPGALPSQKTGP